MTADRAARVGLPHLLDAAAALDGLLLLTVLDPHTGTVVLTRSAEGATGEEFAAAGAADIMRSLGLMAARVSPQSELDDVLVTLTDHQYLLRTVLADDGRRLLVLLVVSRAEANTAMALRILRRMPLVLPELGTVGGDRRPDPAS